ncbi:putative O-methyltransferase YrrM [Stackebrandtia endophytica]|uniref:Putative O-methyltransferase YrrM n=1 Tax=Stackebrandtia endophytica TaxID=1496996 RepID=A0A543AZL1_9ACTN|nr:class I SAM-dependent methyltransferase [Stackebrandtia endophytica]TQL78025.1 putative O-methyltransferase YrrM [Stackebrandtia endophytica]
MFERFLRLKVIVPVLAAMTAISIAAYVGFGLTGLVVMITCWQLMLFGVVAMVARGQRLLLRDNREQLKRANRQLADRATAEAARHDELLQRLIGLSREVAAERRQRTEEHRETQAWRKGAGAQLKALEDKYATSSELRELVEKHSEKMTSQVAVTGRKQYAKVDALSALYYGLRPPKPFPTLAGWAASPDLLRYLFNLVHDERRSSVIECGSGVTTLVMAYAMRELGGGKVIALEHLAEFAEQTRGLLEEHGVSEWAEVYHAPLTDVKIDGQSWQWYDLTRIPESEYDLLVVDGPPATVGENARFPAVPMLQDRLNVDAVVVLDDHERREERAIGKRWREQLSGWRPRYPKHDKGTLELRSPEAEARRL